jgi:hypothetical protein
VAQSAPSRFDGIVLDGDELLLTGVAAEKVAGPKTPTMHIRADEFALSAESML